jgi:uncharacterized phage protein gp47/JayE
MLSIPSTQQLSTDYLNLVAAENPNLNPYPQGGEFYVKSFVYASLLSGVYADGYLKFLNIFPQNQAGQFVDKELASLGLPQRQPAFPASGTVQPTVAPTSAFVIKANTAIAIQNSPFSYLFTENFTIPANTTPNIPIVSQALGAGTGLAPGAVLSLVTPIAGAPTFTIQSMVDGGDVEDDAQAVTRSLNKIQLPLLGGARGDYQFWPTKVSEVTGSFVVPNLGGQNIVGVYILDGGSDYDSILESPNIPYTRTASPALITQAYNYVETQRPVTDSFTVSSVDTFTIPNGVINVGVELIPNTSLSTILPGFTITVEQLILREIRRAVIQTPTGGNRVNGVPYLFASDIADTLGLGLSAKPGLTGLYATILLDWEVTLVGGAPNYQLPVGILSDGNYPYIYDILYNYVSVTLLGD